MLSRTADKLYWLSRYMERAESTARILDIAYRMSRAPVTDGMTRTEWSSAVTIAGHDQAFYDAFGEANEDSVIGYMALDPGNPSSIYSCIRTARENAREVRQSITTEMWESLNSTWLEIRDPERLDALTGDRRGFFDWVKERSHLFRGVTVGTMLQDDAFQFSRLGTFIERADNTARILDVKYHVLLPGEEQVGGALDYSQWAALLRSVSAYQVYRVVYRDTISPHRVAELLVLRRDMPRSLHNCMASIVEHLDELSREYGCEYECQRLAGELNARLRFARIDELFRSGLHEFLTLFINRVAGLSDQIGRDFLMTV